MKIIKILLILFISCLFIDSANSQNIYKFRAKYLAFCDWNDYSNDWGEWRNESECNILIVINMDDLRITVFSKETSSFDIYDYEEDNSKLNQSIILFYTIDKGGNKCRAKFVHYTTDDEKQLYITYPMEFIVVYGIKALYKDY